MNSVIKKQSDSEAVFIVTLDEAALSQYVASTYDRLRQNLKVAGFRPGKAPNQVVDRELGSSAVQSEILEAATSYSYAHAVRDHQLPVVTQPEVKLLKFVPYTELEYEATVELLPPIKLADYKKLKTRPTAVKVETDEIDRVIEDLRQRAAERTDADRVAKNGDEVTIDFAGSKDGQPVSGATAQNYPLRLGSNAFIPGFEEQVIGLKAGADKDFDITFPADYGEKSLAGQPVRFKIKVHRVVELKLPEIDDTFAAAVGPHQTVADLRAAVTDMIKGQKDQDNAQAYERELLAELQTGSNLKVPQKLIDQQVAKLSEDLERTIEQRGQTKAEYAATQGTTMERIDQEIVPEATRRIELALILTEIAKLEEITVTPTEIDDELARLRSQYTDPEMQKELSAPETREEIYNHLMASRTIAKIRSYNEGS